MPEKAVDFLEEIVSITRSLGQHKVIEILRYAKKYSQTNDPEQLIREYIVSCICIEFKTGKTTLIKGRENGNRPQALMFCYALMHQHLEYSYDKIGKYFGGKPRDQVGKVLKKFRALDPQNRIDKKILDVYNQLEAHIQQFITELKKQNFNKKGDKEM